ncbi:hypothetical protein SERLADRAFT_387016 [Serpula lacrymans var. lacrymans S7.9]|uniref:Uncharacterized protein n=1 Tax=Serpula lacrymans var. lacrymans (strain S7.9) TaxID=578457 RepID=F8NV49_SERL9|nr:uncharacterized protein SERLADRAFT_387016 [Serpula lacrymans var. lacrymans S7.9]EGO25311.1 hypothetical protein SERLADRAFT_387016 [Serpula lacrymans var. lacrymans S7.9]
MKPVMRRSVQVDGGARKGGWQVFFPPAAVDHERGYSIWTAPQKLSWTANSTVRSWDQGPRRVVVWIGDQDYGSG